MNIKPEKKALFNDILKNGFTVHLDFNPNVGFSQVPLHLYGADHCRLDFDGVRCINLSTDEHGVSAGMTFNGRHFSIFVPWKAVYCISFDSSTGPRGVLYNDDVPQSVIDSMVKAAKGAEAPVTAAPKQASLQGGAKIYDLAEARARRAARKPGPTAG